MLKNHLKIALRQLKKQMFYSSVNIIGLGIGVACCLLIALFIKDELSYDKHHLNLDNLYRVYLDVNMTDWSGKSTAIPPILAKTMVTEIPEVEKAARLNPHYANAGSNLIRKQHEKENQFEDGFVYSDPEFFDLFHLPLIYGDKNNILNKPNMMVISERMAQKYYPNQNPVGEILILDDNPERGAFKIMGVMENIPEQSHFDYDFFLSMSTLTDSKNTTWVANNYYAYVALRPGTQPEQLEEKLRSFSIKNFAPQYKERLNTDLEFLSKTGHHFALCLQPVKDIYLHSSEYNAYIGKKGDIRYVWLFGAIALFILLIALVNFINLSTARSANRAKEVGLRKVLGSMQKQLVSQFLLESILMSFLAFFIGTLMANLFLPLFNQLAGKTLSIPFTSVAFIPIMFGVAILAGILAGLYPSFYLSAFQPVKVLKGKLSTGSKSGWLRSSLVVVQFAISIGLIAGTIVVYKQMEYIQNKKLGFDRDQVLLIEDTYTIIDQLPSFKNSLKKLPEVKNATVSSYLPLAGGRRNSMAFNEKTKSDAAEQVFLQAWLIDEDYIKTMGMNMKEGRNFNPDMQSDSTGVILNETAVRSLGLGNNPIGKMIASPFDPADYKVIGVVEDFHFESLKGKVSSVGFFMGMSSSVVSVKTTASEMDNLIAKAAGIWKTFAPSQPFRYGFLDDRFAKMYKTEDRVSKLFLVFSILAIFIACLGLLALATFMTEQRMKEIGIRKVLGASVPNIVFSLSKKFLIYVLIGLFIAVPIAWMQMYNWLNNFAYRIDLEWWVFALAGILAIGIAFITVGTQSLRAALVNPVESIRGE